MTTSDAATAVMPARHYLNEQRGIKSWLLTTDHKRIGLLYLFSITAFFFLGGFFALLIRLQLLSPEGALMSSDVYNRMFTMHGVIMVFFFLIPSIPATLGNFLIPIMIGAKDLAFPRINLLSWYIYVLAGVFVLASLVFGGVARENQLPARKHDALAETEYQAKQKDRREARGEPGGGSCQSPQPYSGREHDPDVETVHQPACQQLRRCIHPEERGQQHTDLGGRQREFILQEWRRYRQVGAIDVVEEYRQPEDQDHALR